MTPPLVFVSDVLDPVLDAGDEHHLRRVLRVRPGDDQLVADGAGRWRACRLGAGGRPPSLANPTVLVGPEGGWSEAERSAGMASVTLGPHVLRAETAAMAAAFALVALRHRVVTEGGHC